MYSRRHFLKTAAALPAFPLLGEAATPTFVYLGCYTEPRPARSGPGISVYRLDPLTGALELAEIFTETRNPSFLALDPTRRFLYAVNEIANYEDRPSGSVSAFAIHPETGGLTLLNMQATLGRNPAHVSVDPTGRFVLVANYSGGNIALFPIRPDGSLAPASDMVMHEGPLGPNTARQEAPHPHQIQTDPTGTFAIVNDLGLDRTFVYRIDAANGKLLPHSSIAAEPGAGPRHLAYHPAGRWVYRINELNNTMSALEWMADAGEFRNIQALGTLPDGFQGVNTTAQVLVAPYGKFVYGSNRGHQSIVLFNMDADTGVMEQIAFTSTEGETPRNFGIDPAGNFLFAANQATNNVTVLRMNRADGKLAPAGVSVQTGTPTCVVFLEPLSRVEARPGVLFQAFTNPIYVFDGTGLARNALTWNAPLAREVEVRAGAPDGALVGRFPNAGGLTTGKWIPNGQRFFLQDVSPGSAPGADSTLAVLTVEVRSTVA